MANILHAIDTALDSREPVYVHCWGGIGRTGTVVGCFLIRHGLASRQNVLEKIAGFRKIDLWIRFTDNPFWWKKYPG